MLIRQLIALFLQDLYTSEASNIIAWVQMWWKKVKQTRKSGSATEHEEVGVLYLKQSVNIRSLSVSEKLWVTTWKVDCTDQPGIALLLNEINSNIEILIFLFPYFATLADDAQIFGTQSLMLPLFFFRTESHFIHSYSWTCMYVRKWTGIKLSLLVEIECPLELTKPDEIQGIFTDAETNNLKLKATLLYGFKASF